MTDLRAPARPGAWP